MRQHDEGACQEQSVSPTDIVLPTCPADPCPPTPALRAEQQGRANQDTQETSDARDCRDHVANDRQYYKTDGSIAEQVKQITTANQKGQGRESQQPQLASRSGQPQKTVKTNTWPFGVPPPSACSMPLPTLIHWKPGPWNLGSVAVKPLPRLTCVKRARCVSRLPRESACRPYPSRM